MDCPEFLSSGLVVRLLTGKVFGVGVSSRHSGVLQRTDSGGLAEEAGALGPLTDRRGSSLACLLGGGPCPTE